MVCDFGKGAGHIVLPQNTRIRSSEENIFLFIHSLYDSNVSSALAARGILSDFKIISSINCAVRLRLAILYCHILVY